MVVTSRGPSPHPPPQPLLRPGQLPEHCPGCATLPLPSSEQALGQSDTCITSPKLCAWNYSRLFLISHPKLSWEKFANRKCHRHGPSQAREVPHHRNVIIWGRNKLPHFLFSHLKAKAGLAASLAGGKGRRSPLLLGARSRCRCTAAARRGNLGPGAGNPQKGTIQHLFVQSHSNPAKGYSEDGNWSCRQGGASSQGQTSLAKVGGLEVAPHPQRNPHEVSWLCSLAKVPELTLPIAGKGRWKSITETGKYFPVWGLDGVMVKGIYTS